MSIYWDNADTESLSSIMSDYESWAALPAGTLQTIAQIESSYDPSSGNFKNGCNYASACGLMQLRPVALRDIDRHYGVQLDPLDPYEAAVAAAAMFNINRGYLRYYTKQDPDINALIAAYNGGWGAGRNYMLGRRIPRETMNYLARANQYMGLS